MKNQMFRSLLQRASRLLIFQSLLIVLTSMSSLDVTDVIDDDRTQRYGRIVSIQSSTIKFKDKCQGEVKTIGWPLGTMLQLNDECIPPDYQVSRSPATIYNTCPKVAIFKVYIENKIIYGSTIVLDDQNFTITLANNQRKITCSTNVSRQNVKWMVYREICQSEIPNDVTLPSMMSYQD